MAGMNEAQADLGFSFRAVKSGEVFISCSGRTVTTLRGRAARDFLEEMEATDFMEQQQTMARLTGNYKRGNERLAASHPRSR